MRTRHTTQPSIFRFRPEHEISDIFDGISRWLDDHPEVLAWVEADLVGPDGKRLGRTGMTCDQVLRIGLIKQYRQCSYRELHVSLADSLSIQYFARVDPHQIPARSTLQGNVSSIKAETWERLNQRLVASVLGTEFEPGDRIRIDSTVSETHILDPTDSKLLYDSLRVMVRFLKKVKPRSGIKYVNHTRRAKRRWLGAHSAKQDSDRAAMYRDLIKDVDKTRVWVLAALESLKNQGFDDLLITHMEEFLPLVATVMDQTQRRVFEGETVPASEKLVSVFEPHTDIIKKGGR